MLTEKCRHEKIRGLYIEQLAYAWKENSTMEATGASVDEKVESFTEGDLEYAAETLSALWEIANKDGDIKAPASTSSAVSQFHFCLLSRVMRKCSLHITSPRSPRVMPAGPL